MIRQLVHITFKQKTLILCTLSFNSNVQNDQVSLRKRRRTKKKAIIEGFLDTARKIRKTRTEEDNFLEIPITEASYNSVISFLILEQKNPEFLENPNSLKESLKSLLSEAELASILTGWQVLGDIIIVFIPEVLEDKKTRIAEALLSMYPRCRTVVRDFGIEGQFSQPKRELLLGIETETIHMDHGCFFKQDVTKVMYSKGNLEERSE